MAYLNTTQRTVNPTKNDSMQPAGRAPTLYGVFLGFVKDAGDIQRNGRLKVWIPEFGSPPDNPAGWIIVHYASPFAGATNIATADSNNVTTFEGTQTSYGMWMIPPDVNNQVLVMFINGDPSRGVYIGCLYNQFMNSMVPGMAASTNNFQYPGKPVPVAEYNKYNQKVVHPDQTPKPYEATKFKGVGNQGLINDRFRGVTDSSARREAPSEVFGIITPGPVINKPKRQADTRRKGGSSFIMDDAEGSEYVQLATKSGAQIKINETTGFIYIINRDGTAWIQLDHLGNVDVFGARHISMRAQYDFNIRADRNVNIEAGQNVYIKAAKDTKKKTTQFTYDINNKPNPSTIPVFSYMGPGKGDGGQIVFESAGNFSLSSPNGLFLSGSSIGLSATGSISSSAGGTNSVNGASGVTLNSSGSIDLSSAGSIRQTAGGSLSMAGGSDVVICAPSSLNMNSAGNVTTVAGGSLVSYDSNTPPPEGFNPTTAEQALSGSGAGGAVTKPMNEKINILATWKPSVNYLEWKPNTPYQLGDIRVYEKIIYIALIDIAPSATFDKSNWDLFIPEDKFKRNSENIKTTVSRMPTYEPCPEHLDFSMAYISDYKPPLTAYDLTYAGSGGAGSDASSAPPDVSTPATSIPGVPTAPETPPISPDENASNVAAANINIDALRCQLTIHEGRKAVSYLDSVGLLTGGIGHLLRSNEIPKYPKGTPISDEQIEAWYTADSAAAIKIAQDMFITVWDSLSGIRKRALADLAYNLGKGGLGKFVNFGAAIKAQNFDQAGQELYNSVWYKQVGRRGPNIVAMIVKNVDPNGCDRKFPG